MLFLFYAASATALIAGAMPPFQAADELAQAQRADEISGGEPVAGGSVDRSTAGGIVHEGLARLAAPFDPVRFHPKVRIDRRAMLAAASVPWGAALWQPFPNTAIYPPMFYLPASAGLLLGRMLHVPLWHAVILARLLNGIASVLVAALAIGLAERSAPLLFTLLCLPMTLALFGAISQDGPMIACAALGSVLLARPGVAARSFVSGCALLALVAMGKPVYLPLCLFPLLASGRPWIARVLGTGLSLAACIAWVVATGRWVMPTSSSAHIAEQIAAIRQHPSVLRLVLHTTLHDELGNGLPVGREFIGVLGWLDTTLPNPFYALAGIMLLLAAAVSRRIRPDPFRFGAAPALLLIMASIAAVYVVQYLSWSRIGGATLEGVQGRYLLPIAPFLVYVLPHGHQPPVPRRLTGLALPAIAAFPVLSIALTLRAILVRYYFG